MSISDPTYFKAVKPMDINVKENPSTSWKADLQQVMEDLESNHVNRALKLCNKKPTPYERKKAAKKGSSSHNINDFSKMIVGNFPVAENFESPWIYAQAIDEMLIKYKTIGLSMENKNLIVKEIDNIRSDFVKMFDIFMKKYGYCCGSTWGSKYIGRWCNCTNQSPIIFVEKKINDLYPKVFCENCIDKENRENCRETHRHDYVEMERFKCQKCQKELHRQCSESFVPNCCKSCDSTQFRYNSTSTKEAISSSPSSTSTSNAKSDITNLIQEENCFVKLLSEKKCPFSKPDLLETAINYISILKNEQQIAKDDAINQYLKPSNYLLQVYGLFYSTNEGDILLGIGFCETHFNRCLIEILALPTTTTPTLKNELKKEIITKFFIGLIILHRNLVKNVHLRVPSDLKGLSAEIFANLIVELPRQNIAVKTLKETLSKKMSFFQIPCFSNDPRFIEIIHVIHELGFKINGKAPKLRSYLSIKDAAQNYINQLTNELVINGYSTSQPSETCIETITEEKVPLILTANDLFQAMTELHLKFSDIQSCYYSTFKIVSFFYDPRLKPLPKSQSVESGYSSLNSPTSSTNSINYGHLINEEIEATHVEKKPDPSPIELKGVKKRRIEHEISYAPATITSTISECDEYDENTNTMDASTLTPNSNIITTSSPSSDLKKFKYSIQYSNVSFNSSKEEEENCNICIPLTSMNSTSSTFFDSSTTTSDEKNVSFQVDPYPTASPQDQTYSTWDSENEFQDVTRCPSVGSWMDYPSPLSDIEEDNDDTRSFSSCASPTFEEEEDDDFEGPAVFDSTSSPSSTEQDQPRCSTPCSAILKLLPPLYPSMPLSAPKEEVEEETEENVSTENPFLNVNITLNLLFKKSKEFLERLAGNPESSISINKNL